MYVKFMMAASRRTINEVSKIFTSIPTISRSNRRNVHPKCENEARGIVDPDEKSKRNVSRGGALPSYITAANAWAQKCRLKRAVSHMFRSTSFRPTRVETQIAPPFLGLPVAPLANPNEEIRREIFHPGEYTGRDPEIISLMSTV